MSDAGSTDPPGLGRHAVPRRGGGDRRLHREDPARPSRRRADGEIVVCDNGSTDRSVAIAERMGARVVHQPRGDTATPTSRASRARGARYLVMGDADDTYDFTMIPRFLAALRDEGCDFVTGSRYLGGGDRHITALHRWFGNPALTRTLNTALRHPLHRRVLRLPRLHPGGVRTDPPGEPRHGVQPGAGHQRRPGRAQDQAEIPIVLAPRKGESKLRTFRDGWRSLRMMLLYSPNKLFFVPGAILLASGPAAPPRRSPGPGAVRRAARPRESPRVFATIFSVVGFQILSLGLHAKTYSWSRRFDRDNRRSPASTAASSSRAACCWAPGWCSAAAPSSPPSWSSGCAPTCCRCRTRSGRRSGRRWSSWASAPSSPRSSSPRCP